MFQERQVPASWHLIRLSQAGDQRSKSRIGHAFMPDMYRWLIEIR